MFHASCTALHSSKQQTHLFAHTYLSALYFRQLVESVELAAAQKQERLEAELHSHKTNLIKESIRLGHNDLGDFFYNRGDLQVTQLAQFMTA